MEGLENTWYKETGRIWELKVKGLRSLGSNKPSRIGDLRDGGIEKYRKPINMQDLGNKEIKGNEGCRD